MSGDEMSIGKHTVAMTTETATPHTPRFQLAADASILENGRMHARAVGVELRMRSRMPQSPSVLFRSLNKVMDVSRKPRKKRIGTCHDTCRGEGGIAGRA
jgi:hypothetical protein